MNKRHLDRARGERGVITAELALGLPLLIVVSLAMAWLLSVVVAQVRVVDAAREAARAVARGDSVESATAVARRVAPSGAEVSITTSGGEVRVVVRARLDPPGGGLIDLVGVEVHSEAVAVDEGAP